jgi:hypothetical protein
MEPPLLSVALASALLLDAAELLLLGLFTGPPPSELSDIGGDFEEYFRFTDD